MQRRMLSLLALGLAVTGLSAQSEPGMFKFSGFGTLAVTKSSEKNADFIPNYVQPSGSGFTRSLDLGGDSNLGAQVDARFNDTFSAVVQGISERRYDDTFTPYLSMAHLKVSVLPSLSFRVGRIPYSSYLISEFQKVGYAQPWVRPPVEVYEFNPLTSVDGADINWQLSAGRVVFSGQLIGGTSNAKLAPSANAVKYAAPGTTPQAEWKGEDLGAVSLAASYGHATFRVFHLQMKGTYNDPGFDGPAGPIGGMSPFVALRTLPAAFGGSKALADQFQIIKDKLIYQSVGFNYDPGNWFLMVEETRKSGDENLFLHFTSGYATLGVRFGNWTPYATTGWKHTTSPTTNPNPIINAVLAGVNRAQSSYSAGLRWDFYTNLALKVQYDSVKNATGSYGALTNAQPGLFKTGESYNVTTVALNFVF
jgi:hypothetical protein